MLTPRVLWQEQGTEVRLEKYNTENENKEKESKRYMSHAHKFEFNIFPSTQNISVDTSYTLFLIYWRPLDRCLNYLVDTLRRTLYTRISTKNISEAEQRGC